MLKITNNLKKNVLKLRNCKRLPHNVDPYILWGGGGDGGGGGHRVTG